MERELIEHRRIGNSITSPHLLYTSCNHFCQVPLCAHPKQPLTSVQRPLMFGVRGYLIRVTCGKCTVRTIRNWHTTPFIAPRQRLIHTNPRSAPCAISTAQNYHPNVRSNSSSGIGSASTPASCNNRSCPNLWRALLPLAQAKFAGLQRAAGYHTGSQPAAPNQRPSATASRPRNRGINAAISITFLSSLRPEPRKTLLVFGLLQPNARKNRFFSMLLMYLTTNIYERSRWRSYINSADISTSVLERLTQLHPHRDSRPGRCRCRGGRRARNRVFRSVLSQPIELAADQGILRHPRRRC